MSGSAGVFPVIVHSRGASHPCSCLRQGYISFGSLHMALVCTENSNKKPLSSTDIFEQQSEMS